MRGGLWEGHSVPSRADVCHGGVLSCCVQEHSQQMRQVYVFIYSYHHTRKDFFSASLPHLARSLEPQGRCFLRGRWHEGAPGTFTAFPAPSDNVVMCLFHYIIRNKKHLIQNFRQSSLYFLVLPFF